MNRDARDRFRGALRVDLEVANRINGVAEQLDAYRALFSRRKEIDDAAAEGEVADVSDEISSHEAPGNERLEHRVRVDLFADGEAKRACGEVSDPRESPEECADRDEKDVDGFFDQMRQ